MKKTSTAGLVLGLIATVMLLIGFFGAKTYFFEEMAPSKSSSEYRVLVELFDLVQAIYVGLAIINALGAIFAGKKLGSVLLTIVAVIELIMFVTIIPSIFNFIAASKSKKHYKQLNA